MLFLIPTPIGNLKDITFRAIETLKECDYILCEDTRRSKILLQHYNIVKPLKSYHKFNEKKSSQEIIEDLKNGKRIALISDAGTPGIADPGEIIVKQCIQEDIEITALPGPCAAITALCASGLPTERFQFVGFLPKKTKELMVSLEEILKYNGSSICYESPQRLLNVLSVIKDLDAYRQLTVARELTKSFEEYTRGIPEILISHFTKKTIKGEIVLIIDRKQTDDTTEEISVKEAVEQAIKRHNISMKEAVKLIAGARGLPKRVIYNSMLENNNS